ncbi:aminopeptidase [Tenacibaculum sp. IB213877]|uniref:aminopeptidase n=1 Tax=Tenacibaculum sp. IB213877 TaxID=3097351 RepID=UPI002A5A6A5F|nr:aminopeptidase [Tenacibaculum sp. IB213877]MDY0781042.1 aminopeptidase [Tenacibaculum sp. IB213877]
MYSTNAQENAISITAELDTLNQTLKIQQKTIFYNKTGEPLTSVYLHNWANSFKNKETPLGKRLIEDYKKDFFFAKPKNRGFSKIYNITVNKEQVSFSTPKNHPDVVKILLNRPFSYKDSIEIRSTYIVKIPSSEFTGYGKNKNGYHLRFWYMTPAVFNKKWQLMSNLNMDDLYQDIADYEINLKLPKNYFLESNLYQYENKDSLATNYYLVGGKKKDIILSITRDKIFKSFQTENTQVKTDIHSEKIEHDVARKIINQQVNFIEEYMGKHPHVEILVDANTVNRNSLKELFGLPSWLKPYPENFRWEMRFFQALSSKYLHDILLLNPRKDYWLTDGIQTFLMMEYIKKYHNNVTLLGKYSKYWGLRTYNIAKMKQVDKYPFLYQISARKFYDQALTTPSEKLSNFNRKVISKYKAGLGLKYLQGYVGDSTLRKSLKEFYTNTKLKISESASFDSILTKNTDKDVSWFFGDYIHTTKNADYKITKIKLNKTKDSLAVTIKNKRDLVAPVALYGVHKKEIKFKQWVAGVDSTKTVTIARNGFDKLALNYEQIYPEYNSFNNFRNVNNTLLNKPLQFRLFKDVENPYYNQVFFTPDVKYNFYDGVLLGIKFNNHHFIERNFEASFTPYYATKSNNITGGFSLKYNHYVDNNTIYKIVYGISGSNYHYAPNLGYHTFSPYASINFSRNSLRDVGYKYLLGRLIYINKEIETGFQELEKDKYKIANLRYVYSKPDVIKSFQYALNAELGNNFTKLSADVRYREYFDVDRSFDIRFFGGIFATNNTDGNYFSFSLNRGSDYLFEQNLFGRSEQEGIFSQQYIVTDGGFKSFFKQPSFANQLIMAGNSSISVWKWLEVYNDLAMLKNYDENPRMFYENGIRLNFIPNIFEFYFPIYTNEGWQVNQPAYPSKVRFVITTNLDRIYNFIRRGLL